MVRPLICGTCQEAIRRWNSRWRYRVACDKAGSTTVSKASPDQIAEDLEHVEDVRLLTWSLHDRAEVNAART